MAVKLLLLAQGDAANVDAGLALAADWKREGGSDACWCWPAKLAVPAQLAGGEIDAMPPAPAAGGVIWSALCRTLAGGAVPLLAWAGTPGLDLARLRQAQALLAGHDAVFGASSRGCVLVGLKRAVPELFAGIPWDAGWTMAAVRARARHYRCDLAELAPVLN